MKKLSVVRGLKSYGDEMGTQDWEAAQPHRGFLAENFNGIPPQPFILHAGQLGSPPEWVGNQGMCLDV